MYQRTRATLDLEERNVFQDGVEDGMLRYEDGRLTLHWKNYDLDLQQRADQTWVGRFHRGNFDQTVVLRRPRERAGSGEEWFLGTWLERSGNAERCVHLGREPDGTFAGWTDLLHELGDVRYAPQVQRPLRTSEEYGALAAVRAADRGSDMGGVSVELNVLNGGCCSTGFEGTRQADGGMRAVWHGGPGSPAGLAIWRRVQGNSCVQ